MQLLNQLIWQSIILLFAYLISFNAFAVTAVAPPPSNTFQATRGEDEPITVFMTTLKDPEYDLIRYSLYGDFEDEFGNGADFSLEGVRVISGVDNLAETAVSMGLKYCDLKCERLSSAIKALSDFISRNRLINSISLAVHSSTLGLTRGRRPAIELTFFRLGDKKESSSTEGGVDLFLDDYSIIEN